MDYLDRIYFDNSLRSYLVILSGVLVILLLKRMLSKPFALIIYHIACRFWKTIDKKEFIHLILKPLGWFLVSMATIASLSTLNFPSALDIEVFDTSVKVIVGNAAICAIIITCTLFITRLVDFTASTLGRKAKLTDDKRDDQIIAFSRDLFKISISIIGILITIRFGLGFDISSLLTGLSIVGAALALAAKETIENLIGSFIIFIDKPFHAGDLIRINNITGIIEHIGMRSTRIRTGDKTLVTIPNRQMVDSVVDNWSLRTGRRAEIRLDLSVHATTGKLENLLEGIRKILSEKKEIASFTVFFTDLNKSGKTLVIEFFTGPVELEVFNSWKEELNISLAKLMEDLSIEMASGANVTLITEPGISTERNQKVI